MQIIKVKKNKQEGDREREGEGDTAALLANSLDSSIPVDLEIILEDTKLNWGLKRQAR